MPSVLTKTLNEQAKHYNALFQIAKRYRERHKDAKYQEVANYINGDQEIRRIGLDNPEQNDFVINYIYRDYNLAVSMMARDKPTTELFHINDDKALSDLVKKMVNFILTKNNSVEIIEKIASFGLPFARAYTKTTWDPRLRGGIGDIRIGVVDPRKLYFMPGVGRLGQALIVFEEHEIDKLTALHILGKEKKKEVDALFDIAQEAKQTNEEYAEEAGTVHTQLTDASDPITSGYVVDTAMTVTRDKPTITLIEAWFYDDRTLSEIPELFDDFKVKNADRMKDLSDEDLQKELQLAGQVKPFRRGRVCLFCGNHKIRDYPNPLPCFPYAEYFNLNVPSAKPGDELGCGEWDQLIQIQDAYNTRFNQLMDAMDKIALGGWGLYEEGSGIDVDEMDSAPMGWYSCYDVTRAKWFETRPIGGEAFGSLGELKKNFEDVTGRQEILQADMPGDLRSGAAIEELSQLAFGVMKPRTHHLEICLKQTVENIIRLIGFFYEVGDHYEVDEEMGGEPLKGITPDVFNIFIKAGLNLPSSEQARQAYYLTLQERGAVDNLFLLENSEIPNKEATITRMEQNWKAESEMKQKMAEMEMSLKQSEINAQMMEIQLKQQELALKEVELAIKAEQGERSAESGDRNFRRAS